MLATVKPFTLTIQIADLPEDEKRRRLWEVLDLLWQTEDKQHAGSKEKATTGTAGRREKIV